MLNKLLFILLFASPLLLAKQLVYVEVQKGQDAEKLFSNYAHPIFFEDRFILTLEADSWNPISSNQKVIGSWNDNLYYYVLYPTRQDDFQGILNFGNVLLSNPGYLIFETPHEVLNDFELFHQFELVRLFDQRRSEREAASLSIHPSVIQFNSVIQQMVDSVSIDSIWNNIATLQAMERYTTNTNAIASSNYLMDYYIALGFDSVYFHNWHSGWIPNVVAVKYGKQFPDEIYVVGCHYDVYTNGAPGADDNASGTASVMELARVLSSSSYKRTIKLISFSGEELGLLGSAAYASQAAQQGENILGMINMDMIAYVAPSDPIDVDLLDNTASTDLANSYISLSQMYVPSLSVVDGYLVGGTSDHASFWNNGFKAIFPFEDSDHYSPYIHTSNDILGVSANNQTLAELGTKSVVATVSSLAEIAESRITGHVYSSETLAPIQGATIFFNGDSVQTDLQGYYVTPPLNPGAYSIIFAAAGFASDTMNHVLQQFELFTADAYLIPQGTLRPYVHLQNIVIDDDSSGHSSGNGNGIADAGETVEIFGNFMNTGNLDAHDVLAEIQAVSPWITIMVDTIEVDSVPVGGTAISNNAFVVNIDPGTPKNTEIQFSLTIDYQGYVTNSDFKLMVLNRGDVLIVEDDNGGNGLSAYTAALDTLDISYDVGNPNTPLTDIQEYDFMIWFCGTDYNSTLSSADQQKLMDYLNSGGKLFINGNDIGYDINGDPFYSNYLKANYLGDGPYSPMSTAYGISGDPISNDFTSGMGINNRYVDQIDPLGGADKIFYYSYSGTDYGCGIKYDGNYQLVYLTFAFEDMPNSGERKLLMFNICKWFGVVTGISPEPEEVVKEFSLSQNYPNPFNPVTHIRFGLARLTNIKIEVYNILGQRVVTLLDAKKPAGQHVIEFDGRDFASGVYLYRIQAGEFSDVKKMILIK